MLRIMTKCNKQYIVVKSQYVLHILQYIANTFWHIFTALNNSSVILFDNETDHTYNENSIKSYEGKVYGTQEISDVCHNYR